MLPNFIEKFKRNKDTILLIAAVLLLCLLSFGLGFLTSFYSQKPPLTIENPAGE
ncbi:MAG: hypothetical protein NTZ42_01450 [Candidatus Gribaldobacteria bacterium]|nr:hypothetical protein [Candidatus Gribaldobacteria bacterium]